MATSSSLHTTEGCIPHSRGPYPSLWQDGNVVPYLKATFLKEEIKQQRRKNKSHRCWMKLPAHHKPLPCPTRLAADCALNHFKGEVFCLREIPSWPHSGQPDRRHPDFSAFTSPFKQSPTSLEIHISAPHRAFSLQQGQAQPVGRSCAPQKAESPQSPPHRSQI